MKIEKTLINEQITNAIENEPKAGPVEYGADDWMRQFVGVRGRLALERMSCQQRLEVLRRLDICSRCGSMGVCCSP